MILNIELPDWADDNQNELYIHYGMELIAIRRLDNKKWFVKKHRCNQCGACCKNLSDGFPFRKEDGTCKYQENNLCLLGIHRPFSCIMDFHDDPKLKPKECIEEFMEIKIE